MTHFSRITNLLINRLFAKETQLEGNFPQNYEWFQQLKCSLVNSALVQKNCPTAKRCRATLRVDLSHQSLV